MITNTPNPPYFAVIATSILKEGDNGYRDAANAMFELASQQPGFLGMDTARQDIGISISYWDTLDSIKAWKENSMHKETQKMAKDWYKSLRIRICRVEREYGL